MNEEIVKFLGEVSKYIRPQKEKTLFSLGGRGHYENPVSDLLAFFMDPAAEHGLGTTFLAAFLECLSGEKFRQLPLERVCISREEQTDNRKRIDLVIRGDDWMMLIENKIYHGLVNPLDDYETYSTKQNQYKLRIMTILCPYVKKTPKNWHVVFYRDYCHKLDHRLQQLQKNNILSKWIIFARELMLHLENELYTKTMEDDAVNFVEKNWKQLKQAQKLTDQYLQSMSDRLLCVVSNALGDIAPREVTVKKEDKFAIFRVNTSSWGNVHIAWEYKDANSGEIWLRVNINNPNESQLKRASEEFVKLERITDGSWHKWQSKKSVDKRAEAEQELKFLARTVERMMSV